MKISYNIMRFAITVSLAVVVTLSPVSVIAYPDMQAICQYIISRDNAVMETEAGYFKSIKIVNDINPNSVTKIYYVVLCNMVMSTKGKPLFQSRAFGINIEVWSKIEINGIECIQVKQNVLVDDNLDGVVDRSYKNVMLFDNDKDMNLLNAEREDAYGIGNSEVQGAFDEAVRVAVQHFHIGTST